MDSPTHSFLLLKDAIGTIQPDDTQQDRLEEFTGRVAAGEFHKETTGRIICDCIDGRCGAVGLMPDAAGGSETLTIADDLTTKSFRHNVHDSTLEQYKATLSYLSDIGQPIGGHTADNAPHNVSGCAANDKLPAVYSFIAEHGDVLRRLAEQLGMSIDERMHEEIVGNAAARTQFSEGVELLDVLRQQANARVSVLKGAHHEVLAAINTRFGTTLDRDALQREFGDGYQAFNVDIWAFPESAKICKSDTAGTSNDMIIAMVYYNLAVAHVICGSRLRIVVVK